MIHRPQMALRPLSGDSHQFGIKCHLLNLKKKQLFIALQYYEQVGCCSSYVTGKVVLRSKNVGNRCCLQSSSMAWGDWRNGNKVVGKYDVKCWNLDSLFQHHCKYTWHTNDNMGSHSLVFCVFVF